MIDTLTLTASAELPDVTITWQDSTGTVIPYATEPHTFTLRIDATPTLVKGILGGDQTGITVADTAPNVTIAFAAGDLDHVAPGVYAGQLWARRSSDGRDRDPYRFIVVVEPGVYVNALDDVTVSATATVTVSDEL
jgi:hypothetical protein